MRNLIALLTAIALPGAINAATLTVESDKLTYAVGETITLTVFGDDETDMTDYIFGRLLYDASRTSFQSANQNSAGIGWGSVSLSSGDGFSDAFRQIEAGFLPSTATALPGILSIVTLTADAVGVVPVSWAPFLTFFGVTSAPGTSFTIVPEPSTGALLGLALLGLAGRRRARRVPLGMRPPEPRHVSAEGKASADVASDVASVC